jgi:hypothetical protein
VNFLDVLVEAAPVEERLGADGALGLLRDLSLAIVNIVQVRLQIYSVQKRFAANLAFVRVALLSLQVLPQRFGVGVGPFADRTVEGFHDDLRILVAVFVVAVEGAAVEDDFAADVALLALFVDPLACRYYQTWSSLTLRQNNMHWLSPVPFPA